jgi:hypothetical protein
MSKRELAPPLPKEQLENSAELLRVWILAGVPCLTINADLFSNATSGYGILLGNIAQHQANAIASGNRKQQKLLFEFMREEIRRVLEGPIDWQLSPYRNYKVESGPELPVPPIAANDDHAFEVVRAWLCGEEADRDVKVALMPLPDAKAASEFCVTLMRLIAREIHKKSGTDETATLETLKKAFDDELDMESEVTGGIPSDAEQTTSDGILSKILRKLGWT